MSADRARLSKAIQRIAREDPEIRELLKSYRNSGGKPSETATSGPGSEDRNICCDGSAGGGSGGGAGSGNRDPGDGGQDASAGLDPDNPANLDDMGPGSLSGVEDCATGESICFEGEGWIPQEGWASPTDPPIDPTYEEDKFWRAQWWYFGSVAGTVSYALTESAACEEAYQKAEEIYPSLDGGGSCSPGQLECSDDSDPALCNPTQEDIDALRADYWPPDGCINLASKGGKLVASKYDPEAQGTAWLKGVDEVELCDDQGNSFKLRPSAGGGWKSISAQNPGDGYLYDSNGQQIARISESEYSDPKV